MLPGNATHDITNSKPRNSTMMLHCLYALPLDFAQLISCLCISYCVETVDGKTNCSNHNVPSIVLLCQSCMMPNNNILVVVSP